MSERDYWRDTGDRPSGFWATYPATKAILIGLAAIHLLKSMIGAADPAAYTAIERLLALSKEDVLGRLRIWQLVTYALLHGGTFHLVFNCLTILFFGRLIEQRIGTQRYVLFAVGSVITAAFGFLLLAKIEGNVGRMIGASGFDFAVLVLAALWYPRLTVMVMFVFPAPLWALALVFGFIEVSMLFDQDGVAHSAHVAGGLYGLIYYRYGGRIDGIFSALDRWRAKQRRHRLEQERRETEALRGEVDRILDKVNREGMAALTDAERRALKEASERLRR
jgi:membrane associated rhomboid family serine protease